MNNHERAASIVSRWPQWKRDVTLTKYSERDKMKKIRCIWHGCEGHPQDSAPPESLDCMHCGQHVDYESLVGITIKRRFEGWLIYWFCRKWVPIKCADCGKRYGKHKGCLPF